MATVRMSKNVSEKILENAKKAYQKTNPYRQFDGTMGDRIYASLYTEGKETIKKIKEFLYINNAGLTEKNESINIEIEGIDTNDYVDPTSRSHYSGKATYYNSINVPLSRGQWFLSENNNCHLTIPTSSSLYSEIMEILNHNEEVYEGLQENKEKVDQIITACVTLNQFLKAWPAGASLVPEEQLQKANERSIRKQAAEERRALVEGMETDLNTTILTSSLLED